MTPLRFGTKPPITDPVTKKLVEGLKPKPISIAKAKPIELIQPRGERLTLAPIFSDIFVTAPEENNPAPDNLIGGVAVPDGFRENKLPGAVIVTVVSTGPEVKQTSIGDRVLIFPQQADKMVYDGNAYWKIAERSIYAKVV